MGKKKMPKPDKPFWSSRGPELLFYLIPFVTFLYFYYVEGRDLFELMHINSMITTVFALVAFYRRKDPEEALDKHTMKQDFIFPTAALMILCIFSIAQVYLSATYGPRSKAS